MDPHTSKKKKKKRSTVLMRGKIKAPTPREVLVACNEYVRGLFLGADWFLRVPTRVSWHAASASPSGGRGALCPVASRPLQHSAAVMLCKVISYYEYYLFSKSCSYCLVMKITNIWYLRSNIWFCREQWKCVIKGRWYRTWPLIFC